MLFIFYCIVVYSRCAVVVSKGHVKMVDIVASHLCICTTEWHKCCHSFQLQNQVLTKHLGKTKSKKIVEASHISTAT
jgi:hypothetical protein